MLASRLSIAALAVAFTMVAVRDASAAPPNIVFILADDLSRADPGCYGHPVHDTPHIDRLAREGCRFTQAYAPAPICSASRAAILTGKTPARLGFEFVTKNGPGRQALKVPLQSPPFTLDLPLEEITIGEALADAGYATGFFGKWHVARHHEEYLGWSPTHGPLQQGFVEGRSDFGSHPYSYRGRPDLQMAAVPQGEYPADSLTDAAIEFLTRQREQPCFLYLSQYFVHDPVHSRCDWLVEKYRQRLGPDVPDSRAVYGAMVETLDHLVGRVLDAIDAAGMTNDTLVIFMSDNGGHPNFTTNAPLRGSKWNLYEGGIRVPFIVRWPGHVAAGTTCGAVVTGCDLYPTLCAVAGVPCNLAQRDGVSLLPVLEAARQPLPRERPLVWHFPYYHPEKGFASAPEAIGVGDFVTSQTRPHSAIRVGDWKLLRFHETERVELYDLRQDPSESVDLSAARMDQVDRLREALATYLESVGARMPERR